MIRRRPILEKKNRWLCIAYAVNRFYLNKQTNNTVSKPMFISFMGSFSTDIMWQNEKKNEQTIPGIVFIAFHEIRTD